MEDATTTALAVGTEVEVEAEAEVDEVTTTRGSALEVTFIGRIEWLRSKY